MLTEQLAQPRVIGGVVMNGPATVALLRSVAEAMREEHPALNPLDAMRAIAMDAVDRCVVMSRGMSTPDVLCTSGHSPADPTVRSRAY